MDKPIIGIVGPGHINKDNPFDSYSKVILNYAKRVRQAGGIPIGIGFEEIN